MPMPSTGRGAARYSFDHVVERRGTDSLKWSRYGADVLPLWVADLDFAVPPPVVEAVRRRVEHGVFGYGVEPPEFRQVVQERLRQQHGWVVDPEWILFLPGVVVGFNLATRALAGTGGGVLIQPPAYPPFFRVGSLTGAQLQEASLVFSERGFEIDLRAFESAITPSTRLLLLCNPHNPVGRVFTQGELASMAEICLRHDLFICSDEIHQDFVFDGRSHRPIATLGREVADRTVTLLSPSKSYNLAGFHCAMAVVGNPELRARLEAARGGLMPARPGVLDLVAATAAYAEGDEWLRQLVAYLQANRDFLAAFVQDRLPGVKMFKPEGTYLAWLDCRDAGIPGPPGKFFLGEAKVAVQEGTEFGAAGAGFVRLNFGCPRSLLEEALGRMSRALAVL